MRQVCISDMLHRAEDSVRQVRISDMLHRAEDSVRQVCISDMLYRAEETTSEKFEKRGREEKKGSLPRLRVTVLVLV